MLLEQALLHHQAGRLAEADALYRQVLTGNPKQPDALNLRGMLAYQTGNLEPALVLLNEAVKAMPRNGIFHTNRALVLDALGRGADAEKAYRKGLKLAPKHAEGWNNLGTFQRTAGNMDKAAKAFRKALALNPGYLEAGYNLGVLLLNERRLDEAVAQFEASLTHHPDHPELLINLGVALQNLGRFDEAVDTQERILAQMPENSGALTNLGSIAFEREDMEAAAGFARRAVASDPNNAAAWNNLGTALSNLESFEEAETAYGKALALLPDYADAHGNRANMLKAMGRLDEAAPAYEKALELAPKNARHLFQLSLCRLLRGEIGAGWDLYDAGFASGERLPNHPRRAPRWDGRPLEGKLLHVWPEQGIGDELRAASCFPQMLADAPGSIIECDPRLQPLLARSFPEAQVVAEGEVDENKIDCQVPVGNLGQFYRRELGDFPAESNFLKADPALTAKWKDRLAELGDGLRVGISWRSGLMTARRRTALSQISDWQPVLSLPGIQFVNLQYGDCAAELAEAEAATGATIHHWADLDLKDDLEDVAALCNGLDLVIHIGTSIGDLACGLGRPCWALLRVPEYIMLGTDHLPYYPQARVFPKPYDRTWPMVLEDVADALKELMRQ